MANKTPKPRFEDFLLTEYSYIAEAHFKSIETISAFFRYYLLIMAIPISAIAFFFQIAPDRQQILSIAQQYQLPIFILLVCISLIGVGTFCYITNLRLDALLYARSVNGIRKFFYDGWNKDINLKLRTRGLPQSPQIPSYFEGGFFLPVVGVFGVMNTLYFSFAFYLLLKDYLYKLAILAFVYLILHYVIYWWYCRHRETSYLKSNILGVDIDGVLNKHREQFCKLLYQNTSKGVTPEQITMMPVHEHPDLDVTREDERQVFNDPKYWDTMPVIEDAADNVRKLRNIFKLNIFIFSHRPWPDDLDKERLLKTIKQFLQSCSCFSVKNLLLKIILYLPILRKISFSFKVRPLKQITEEWLKKYRFEYDKFIFEKGNDYSSDPRGQFKNRFYIARGEKIRFFVDDDLDKAIKLSYICDVVFLFSHPYNEPNSNLPRHINELIINDLPSNIIRVKNWTEIYQHIRRLS